MEPIGTFAVALIQCRWRWWWWLKTVVILLCFVCRQPTAVTLRKRSSASVPATSSRWSFYLSRRTSSSWRSWDITANICKRPAATRLLDATRSVPRSVVLIAGRLLVPESHGKSWNSAMLSCGNIAPVPSAISQLREYCPPPMASALGQYSRNFGNKPHYWPRCQSLFA